MPYKDPEKAREYFRNLNITKRRSNLDKGLTGKGHPRIRPYYKRKNKAIKTDKDLDELALKDLVNLGFRQKKELT